MHLATNATQNDFSSFINLKNKVGDLSGHWVIEIKKFSSKIIKNKSLVGRAVLVAVLTTLIFYTIKKVFSNFHKPVTPLKNDQIIEILLNHKKKGNFHKIFMDLLKPLPKISIQKIGLMLGKKCNEEKIYLLFFELSSCTGPIKQNFLFGFIQGILKEGNKNKIRETFNNFFIFEKAEMIDSCLPHFLKSIDSKKKYEFLFDALPEIHNIPDESLKKYLSLIIHGPLGISASEKSEVLNNLKHLDLSNKNYDLIVKVKSNVKKVSVNG